MIGLSVRRPVAISMAYVCIALLGVAAWRNVPIELLPDTALPRLIVTASWPGASPEMTEAFVASPLERAVQQVRGVRNISSVSNETQGLGRASLNIEFARETDMDFARLELSDRLAALETQLPPGVVPRIQQYVPREFQDQLMPVIAYRITGPYTLEALRAHVDEVVIPELLDVAGVSHVNADGGRARVLEIELDQTEILSLGLDLATVRNRIMALEAVREAGAVEEGGVLRTVAIRQRAETAAELRQTPLLTDQGRLVRLDDVAHVRDTYEDPQSFFRIDGFPAVSFSVYRQPGTNMVALADSLRAVVERLEAVHPPGTRVILQRDYTDAIRAQFTDLRFRAIVAAGVIFAVLLLFLGSIRTAAIIFTTIAFSILITLNLIYFGGFTLNVLTLMGMAMGFGLIVDNAIVVLENIYRKRRGGESAMAAAEGGARDVVLPVLAATLTTVVVVAPFVYLQGELQVYYVPLGLVVGFSLLASLFVAFSFIPAVASRMLRGIAPAGAQPVPAAAGGGEAPAAFAGRGGPTSAGGHPPGGRPASDGASATASPVKRPFYVRIYAGLVKFSLRYPWLVLIVAAGALGGSYWQFDKRVTTGVIWRDWRTERTYIDIRITLPRGEELWRTDELARHFEDRLKLLPEVSSFVTTVRTGDAHIRVDFPDSLHFTLVPLATHEQLVAYSHRFGGAQVRVIGMGPAFYGGAASPPNYTIEIRGYNYETVREIAEDLGRRLERYGRIRDVDTNADGRFTRDRASEQVLRLDRGRLALYGLTARDVVQHVQAAAFSQYGTDGVVRLGGEDLRFSLKLDGHTQLDTHELEQLLIPSPNGAGIRLGEIATLEERQVLTNVRRENQQYRRTIAYEFRGPATLGNTVRDIYIEATELPPGYSIHRADPWRWSAEDAQQIYRVLAIAILLIFMVTAALFESMRQPLCVLFTVPMALVGVFMIFVMTDANFTREAYIGVIMMGGVVVNNAILLVDHINQLRRKLGVTFEAAIIQGTLDRVRPILMTTVTTVVGMLPLVLFSETANANIWNALAYCMIGGLTSSTIFVLTVTPSLYYLFERRPERRRLRRLARAESAGTAPARA